MTDTPQVLLQHHLKKLRLPTFNSEYDKLARQCAAENKGHVHYVLRLCELELIERERRMIERRIKDAKFPATKSLDSFDFKVRRSQQDPDYGTGPPRLRGPARERHRTGSKWHRQDPCRPWARSRRLPEGTEGAIHDGRRPGPRTDRGW